MAHVEGRLATYTDSRIIILVVGGLVGGGQVSLSCSIIEGFIDAIARLPSNLGQHPLSMLWYPSRAWSSKSRLKPSMHRDLEKPIFGRGSGPCT